MPMATIQIGTAELQSAKRSEQAIDFRSALQRPTGWMICLALLRGVSVLHIAGGIEWWDTWTYTLETKHTPLARVSVALGPYLAGVRWMGFKAWRDTYPILTTTGNYWHNLTLGRLGVLPYFIIATLVVFFWTKRLFGAPAAVLAAAVFTQ